MRQAAILLFATAFALGVRAEGYGPGLTVLLDFQEAASLESMGEMRREVQQLLQPSGLRVELRLVSEVIQGDTFNDLILVKFKGNCSPPADPLLMDERGPGPLAFAHTADGRIQPFGEVACDSVRRAVESALWGHQHGIREELFGRALGRVVAHELAHILAQSNTHGKTGVFKPSLSGAQLIADHMEFSAEDTQRLRRTR